MGPFLEHPSSPPRIASMWILRGLSKTVIVLTILSIIITRSLAFLYFGLCSTACYAAAKLVKRIIKQPRPSVSLDELKLKDYGMPSTHAAVASCMAAYISLAVSRLPLHTSLLPIVSFLNSEPAVRILALVITIPWAMMIIASRVHLSHHTVEQVIGGAAFGAIFGIASYVVCTGIAPLHVTAYI